MKSIIIIISVCCLAGAATARTWELKKEHGTLKIFTGNVDNSNVKAVRAECLLNTSLSHLAAILMDTKAHDKWVYCTKTSYLVKKISDHEEIYYSEMSVPWPLANRDMVVDLKIAQDSITKVMTINVMEVPGYVPLVKGIVRVPQSTGTWIATPVGKGQVTVEYIGQADPGGSVPAWAVNMFCEKGPYETFKKLEEILMCDEYKDARVGFIRD